MQLDEARILIVEDNLPLCKTLGRWFRSEGFLLPQLAHSTGDALELLRQMEFDLVLLDLCLPHAEDGLGLLAPLRYHHADLRILLMTGDHALADGLKPLFEGYRILKKAFDLDELKEVIRDTLGPRIGVVQEPPEVLGANARGNILRIGGLVLDLDQRQLRLEGEVIHLTDTEFALLTCLMRRPERVIEYQELVQAIQPCKSNGKKAPIKLRRQIFQLRQKIEIGPEKYQYIQQRHRGYVISSIK